MEKVESEEHYKWVNQKKVIFSQANEITTLRDTIKDIIKQRNVAIAAFLLMFLTLFVVLWGL